MGYDHVFEYHFLKAFIQIDPNIKARLYEIDRASTASSLTSKSENPQFS